MQFIKGGPDIPETLLQAHEDGRVVFFCGAGIAYPAGLPGFQGLVDAIYAAVGTRRTEIEEQAYLRGQYDATLDLLERRIPGQRLAVRKVLMNVLKPRFRRKGANDTHAALIQLARSRAGAVRLVTTNFDRIFERLMARIRPVISAYRAPMLPIPKNSRWNGVVYLHGLLPDRPDDDALQRLVLTSGDFGLAYLTERWAARFVSALFRNYMVCFVGYSINDPVLRYMMDALAADRMLGEATPQAYALGDFAPGQERQKHIEWEAKGVNPILYEASAGSRGHSALHRTLKQWADTYRDGVQAKERIVVEYAMARPLASTKQDDYVGRMLWALSDSSGLPAKRFAEFTPAPSLDWLEVLCENRYRQSDLPRFGVPIALPYNHDLAFSLLLRPTPYTHAPWMMVMADPSGSQWDDVMRQMAQWLLRHLNDPALVLWLARRGDQLHETFAWFIDKRIGKLADLERRGDTGELERIRVDGPNSVPSPEMRIAWRLLLTRRIKSPQRNFDFFRWIDRTAREGLTTTLRLELRDLLAPKILLSPSFRRENVGSEPGGTRSLSDLFHWEPVLASDNVLKHLNDLSKIANWNGEMPALLDDFQRLVSDALDLMRELGGADDRSDRGYWDMPSISRHWQNREFSEWVALVVLLRDSWEATLHEGVDRARVIAWGWFTHPYPTFKRLALYAATYEGITPVGEWVDWLMSDDGWWLWSPQTQREAMRLLVLQGAGLPDCKRALLEASILAGPPRRMFRPNLDPDQWNNLVHNATWLRLSKLASGSSALSHNAAGELNRLSLAHPGWKLAANERDEFPHWMGGTSDPDYAEQRDIHRAPRRRRELAAWLRSPQSGGLLYEDDWAAVCLHEFPLAACALCALAREQYWPEGRWREALQTWSRGTSVRSIWRYIAPILRQIPDEHLLNVAHAAASWLESVSKVLDKHADIFLELCRRILEMPNWNGALGQDPITTAINHPVGQVTDALLQHWLRSRPSDNEGIPDDLKRVFTSLSDIRSAQYRTGRLLLAAHLIPLFRVDKGWTSACLLPLFEWRQPTEEARVAWAGFLWSPRLFRPLLEAFKTSFLITSRHYRELGQSGHQYAYLLTYASLDPADTFAASELREAVGVLPQGGLVACAQALINALHGAGDQREQQWQNRIEPFWHSIWPKSRELASKEMAEQLALLAIAAGRAFSRALAVVQGWLQPLDHPNFVVTVLKGSGLCGEFPRDTLNLLDAIISDQPWAPSDLADCLEAIVAGWPSALQDRRYRRLVEYARRHAQ